MPRGIVRQRAAKNRIAGKSMAVRYGLTDLQSPYQFAPGSYTFTSPKGGRWKFVLWGPGGNSGGGVDGGGSGAYVEITKTVLTGQTVALVVSSAGAATTATFLDGAVASAGAGSGITGGTASGGDVNLNGSNGGASGGSNAGTAGTGTGGGAAGAGGAGLPGGAGAPANLPFRGGAGGTGAGIPAVVSGKSPGGGAGDSGAATAGGDGLIIAYLVRE